MQWTTPTPEGWRLGFEDFSAADNPLRRGWRLIQSSGTKVTQDVALDRPRAPTVAWLRRALENHLDPSSAEQLASGFFDDSPNVFTGEPCCVSAEMDAVTSTVRLHAVPVANGRPSASTLCGESVLSPDPQRDWSNTLPEERCAGCVHKSGPGSGRPSR